MKIASAYNKNRRNSTERYLDKIEWSQISYRQEETVFGAVKLSSIVEIKENEKKLRLNLRVVVK